MIATILLTMKLVKTTVTTVAIIIRRTVECPSNIGPIELLKKVLMPASSLPSMFEKIRMLAATISIFQLIPAFAIFGKLQACFPSRRINCKTVKIRRSFPLNPKRLLY